jgi:putative hydrolase of the HAD superfamily
MPGRITPTNFDRAIELVRAGTARESLMSAVCIEHGFFYCERETLPEHIPHTYVFDADDTLWEDNLIYEQIIVELSDYIREHTTTLSPEEIRKVVDEVEHEIIPQMGFGPVGFHVSMQKAFERIVNDVSLGITAPTELFDSILPRLTSVPHEVSDDVVETLAELRTSGSGLILFTQGTLEIQQDKIRRSGLAHYFDAIAVTSSKKPEDYRKLVTEFQERSARYTVVGNSLKSEVIPALEVGMEAVHFLNPNSWHSVNNVELDKERYREIRTLRELLR